MIRAFLAGLCLAAFALFVLLFVSVPGWTKPICDNIDVMRPCAPIFQAERVSKREARRISRGQRLEQAMPFGAPIVRPETQRSFMAGSSQILGGRPAGCPRRFCGCGVSLKVFGRIIPRYNLAANWRDFMPAAPGGGTVAWRPGHVLYVEDHVGGNNYQVYDPNSGGGKIRRHVRNLAGYRFVDPHTPQRRVAGL